MILKILKESDSLKLGSVELVLPSMQKLSFSSNSLSCRASRAGTMQNVPSSGDITCTGCKNVSVDRFFSICLQAKKAWNVLCC